MADDLYTRYMQAAFAARAHGKSCTKCSSAGRCADGQRLDEALARLQDAYQRRLRQGGTR